jgi:NAD(P)-dependent dehydrogenase (short-subunit alcohol dehydrogenase family)
VGHALLFHLLTPALNSDARIVIVASGVHDPREAWPGLTARYTTAEEVARPGHIAQKESNERDRYVTSKVANVVWMYALARHLELAASKSPGDDKRTAVAFDPGAMPGTKLARNSSAFEQAAIGMLSLCVPVLQKLWRANVHTPTESGEALAWLAMGAEAKGKTGVYFEGRTEKESSEVSKVESKQEELWDWTVGFVGRDGEEKQRFRRCK